MKRLWEHLNTAHIIVTVIILFVLAIGVLGVNEDTRELTSVTTTLLVTVVYAGIMMGVTEDITWEFPKHVNIGILTAGAALMQTMIFGRRLLRVFAYASTEGLAVEPIFTILTMLLIPGIGTLWVRFLKAWRASDRNKKKAN